MAFLEPNTQRVLDCLANVEPEESGDGWAIGPYIEARTGLKAGAINDSVSCLADLGYATSQKATLGMEPWKFRLVTLTARGRAFHQRMGATAREFIAFIGKRCALHDNGRRN